MDQETKVLRFDMLAVGDRFKWAKWSDSVHEKRGTGRAAMVIDTGKEVVAPESYRVKASAEVYALLVRA